MNKIENRILKGELKYKNTVVLTYEIEYPEIVSSDYECGKKAFNRYNKEKALYLRELIFNELYKEASKLYDYNTSNGYPVMIYEIILQYNITYNKDFLISLYYDQYEFRGGAHGNTTRTSQTWNLQIGKRLALSYFCPNNPYYIINILKNINNQIKQQIDEGSNYYFDNYCELVLESFRLENYYLIESKKCLAIFFQQYDIAPYSSGIPVFYIYFYN